MKGSQLLCRIVSGAALLVVSGCDNPETPSVPGVAGSGVTALRGPAATADVGFGEGATGSGNTVIAGKLRTFSFTAQFAHDGTARGTAVVENREVGENFQVDVDCLQIVGNVAIMSGVITRHTDTNAIGLTGIFGVADNGEGGNLPADIVTQVFFFRPNTATCLDATPADVENFGSPIVNGNVQVHGE